MDDQTFARLVAEEAKNRISPSQRGLLASKDNWERWRVNLIALLENLDRQIESIEISRKSETARYESFGDDGLDLARKANASYDSRVKKISRFRFHVERRLNDVATMIETGEMTQNDGWGTADFLKRGIAKHREMLLEYGLEETAVDRALWALLDGSWAFDDIIPSDIS